MSQQLADKFGISLGLLDATKGVLSESDAYQAKVKAHMAKKGVKSLNDMTADQKKKFFNELDSMHKAKNEEVESVEEAESHQAKTTMKHISKPTAGEKKAAKDIKPGIAGYRDRVAMLKSAEARGALKKEEVELTQEDLDFIASLNQLDELKKSTLASYAKKATKDAVSKTKDAEYEAEYGSPSKSKKAEEKAEKRVAGVDKAVSRLAKEDFTLEDFTVEEIEEYMQTEEFAQLDELSKTTLGSYIKKRSNDVATQGALTRKHAMDSEAKKKEHGGYTTKAVRDLDDKANKAFMKGWKHRENIGKAVDRLTKG